MILNEFEPGAASRMELHGGVPGATCHTARLSLVPIVAQLFVICN
jgi:hypothetical protein